MQFGSRSTWTRNASESGFTIIELLVVMVILTVLISLLIPAIQAARELARRTQCQNNLKQNGIALLTFHDIKRSFTYGGWGNEWVGVPERGSQEHQPGGWIFSLLPFVELDPLYNLGLNTHGADADLLYSRRIETPVSLFVCPSRRSCSAWPIAAQHSHVRNPKPFGNPSLVARSDYAISGGASNVFSFAGPASIAEGDSREFWANSPGPINFNGISHLRTGASLRSISDGTSKTYLVGEKYVESGSYMTGTSLGDNESMYAGYCTDLHRFSGAIENTRHGLSAYAAPLSDNSIADIGIPAIARFGSAHPTGFNMLFCDGSVHYVPYDLEPEIHLRAGHRSDGGGSFAMR